MTNIVMDKYKIVLEGIEFAAKAHGCQTRKVTDVPYIVHPVRVARILIEYGCPEDVVVAGILHDTIEDTAVTIEDVRSKFGNEVAEVVKGSSEPVKEDTWENRKRHTLEYLKTAPKDVLLVACADKLDNIREIKEGYTRIGEKVWDRFKRGKESQQWYYQSLAEIFVQRAESEQDGPIFHQFNKEVKDFFTIALE